MSMFEYIPRCPVCNEEVDYVPSQLGWVFVIHGPHSLWSMILDTACEGFLRLLNPQPGAFL